MWIVRNECFGRWLAAFVAVRLGSSSLAALAGVTWQAPKVSEEVKPGQRDITVPYTFRVNGKSAVRIEGVDTGCGCSHYVLEKREFAPGEEGTLKVIVDVGDREGALMTPILVYLKDGQGDQVDTLYLGLKIPTLASFSSRVVTFDEKDKSREITVTVPPELHLSLSVGEVAGPYKAELGPADNGRYALRVSATGQPNNGFVQIVASEGTSAVKSWRVFVRVSK